MVRRGDCDHTRLASTVATRARGSPRPTTAWWAARPAFAWCWGRRRA